MSDYLYLLIPAAGVGIVYLVRKLREWQWGWVRSTESLKDKIFIVTGANTGLGKYQYRNRYYHFAFLSFNRSMLQFTTHQNKMIFYPFYRLPDNQGPSPAQCDRHHGLS